MNLSERKSPAMPCIEMIEESMKLMRAYINSDSKTEIIIDGQSVSQHINGPPTYEDVLQTVEATSESRYSYFRQLGSIVPEHLSKKEFERLFGLYENLRIECEREHLLI